MNEQSRSEKMIVIDTIKLAVADYFGIPVEDLKHRSPARVITIPRQIAMYLSKQLTAASLPEIGREFGNKHPTTVMHSIAKIDELRRTDPAIRTAIENLLETLKRRLT